MRHSLAHVAIVVRDHDEAIAFYTGVLGFRLVEDTPREPGKPWDLIEPTSAPRPAAHCARSSAGAAPID